MTSSDAWAQALAESRFYGHLSAFTVVTLVVLGVNLVLGGPMWSAWVGVAWAFAVVSHASIVFGHVLSREWIEGRAALLQATPTAKTLRRIERRLDRIENGPRSASPADRPSRAPLDPFDLDAANAVGRPVAPDQIGVPCEPAFDDDPLVMSREPINTPRLGEARPPMRSSSAA